MTNFLIWHSLGDTLGHAFISGESSTLRTIDGRFLRLNGAPRRAENEQSHGEVTRYLDKVASYAKSKSVSDSDGRWPAGRRKITVLGQNMIADMVREMLVASGAQLTELPDDHERYTLSDGQREADLIIAVTDRTPSAEWVRFVDSISETGMPILRVYAEGAVVFVDPITVETGDVTMSQVLRRRYAATPAVLELKNWHNSQHDSHPAVRGRFVCGAVTSRVLTVAIGWASRGESLVEFRRTQWTLNALTAVQGTHTVLGFTEPRPNPLTA